MAHFITNPIISVTALSSERTLAELSKQCRWASILLAVAYKAGLLDDALHAHLRLTSGHTSAAPAARYCRCLSLISIQFIFVGGSRILQMQPMLLLPKKTSNSSGNGNCCLAFTVARSLLYFLQMSMSNRLFRVPLHTNAEACNRRQ